MTSMPIKICYVALLALSVSPLAVAACPYEAKRHMEIDASGFNAIEIAATSGDLRIRGDSGLTDIIVSGKACANEQDDLPRIQILTNRVEDRLEIIADVPYEEGKDWRVGYLDLVVRLPTGLHLDASDSSGDINIQHAGSLTLTDSSGDIELEHIPGEILIILDSSGDIEIRDAGPVTIRVDSSGDIDIDEAESVIVDQDTSGDIRVTNIRGDVTVGTDSSGVIEAQGVGGNFTVGQDSTGGIRYEAVSGRVSLPEQRQ